MKKILDILGYSARNEAARSTEQLCVKRHSEQKQTPLYSLVHEATSPPTNFRI